MAGRTTQKMYLDGRVIEHLNDLFTDIYYDRIVPYEDDLKSEAAYGERIWKSDPEVDPWESLALAVISGAVIDYVDAYIDGDVLGMAMLKKWFRQNEFTANILSETEQIVRRAEEEPYGLSLLRMRMRRYW